MSAERGNTAYRVTLPEFEGPLDLLLHLCKTHELDIVNIPIAFITEKYLEYLEVMQSMSVDVAADYLVMAATLAYLKSRELVPTPEPLEVAAEERRAALDPREELIRRLLEYQKYKDAAEKLGGAAHRGTHRVRARHADRDGRRGAAAGRAVGLEADRGVRQASSTRPARRSDPRRGRRSDVDRRAHQPARSIGWRRAAGRSGSTPAST